MFLILLIIIIVTLLTYLSLKPLIDNVLYSVPYQPKYIHSYIPLIGFGFEIFKDPIEFIRSFYIKYGKVFVLYIRSIRHVYLYDEQIFLNKVLKSSDLSIDEFSIDLLTKAFNVNRQCLINEDILQNQLKQFHQYLTGHELEILNKRVHDSLLLSIKTNNNNPNKIVNFFHQFEEFMLYATCDGLFGKTFTNQQRNSQPNFYQLFQNFDHAYKLSLLNTPFRAILNRSIFKDRSKFIHRFTSLELNDELSKLVYAREELYRSDKYKDLFSEYDIAVQQAILLWAAIANTGPLSCWIVVDLLLHPEALQAVKQELDENLSSSSFIYHKETLGKLKILDSCIHETMRRISSNVVTRQAITDTTIECHDERKIGLRKGDMLIYPVFLKHLDPNIYGENPYAYQYDRFIKKPKQTTKLPSVTLFGYGIHTCPGRYWAINEIKILVALIIQHIDIEFVNMTEQDKEDYRNKLPYDYSKFISSGGPKKGYEHKFDIKYSYKNLL